MIDTQGVATTGANLLSNVGNHTITASGASDGNYDFTYVDGTLEITKATLTATADNKTRIYGEANPALTITYTGFKNGEDASVIDTQGVATTGANLLSNIGNHTISAGGASDGNYDFTYVAGNLEITRATITVTADNKTRIYGNANPALTVSYDGFKNGQDESVFTTLATATTGANLLSNAGNHAITASGAAAGNYDFVYTDGTLSITKATITVTADNKTRIYGDGNPAFTVSYAGFKNGQDESVFTTLATATTGANLLSNVGNHAITANGAAAGNYDFAYVGGTLSITKATLVATADNKTRIYGNANPNFTVTYTGFKNGENASVIDILATGSTSANLLSNVNDYGITAGGAFDNNYDFTYVGGTLSITKATLVAKPDAARRIYAQADPAFTVTYTGFKNGENASVIDTQATVSTTSDIDSPVGVYELIASGASDSNYDFVYEPGVFTIIPLVQADDPAVSSALTSPLKPEHNGALYDQWRRGEGTGDIFVIFNINQYFAASVEGYVSMASTRAQDDAAPISRPRCDRTKGACIAEI